MHDSASSAQAHEHSDTLDEMLSVNYRVAIHRPQFLFGNFGTLLCSLFTSFVCVDNEGNAFVDIISGSMNEGSIHDTLLAGIQKIRSF